MLLDQAAACQASDVHVDAEEQALRVRFRIDGVLREVPAPPKDLLPAMVSRIKVLAHMDIAETRRPQDGHFKLAVDRQELDIRVSTLPSTNGEAVVMRLLHGAGHMLSLEDLGLHPQIQETFDRLIHLPHGMLLVTGPTGSGKTTTLYSALARVDRIRQSIITLEDPVEIRLPQIRQVSVNPKAGLTFQTGLRSILRQDPDVIMVGEIRDRETAEIALQAALTGHLMLSTLHTNSAAAAPARLLDMGAPDFLVTSALIGVLAQRLCRRLCRHCARPSENMPATLALLGDGAAAALAGVTLLQAVGCKRCGNTGYDGRVGVFELLVLTDEMRRTILAGQDERVLVALARENGMRFLAEDGLAKIRQGLTTVPELLRVAGHIDVRQDAAAELTRETTIGAQAAKAGPERYGTATRFDVHDYEKLLAGWLRPGGQRVGELADAELHLPSRRSDRPRYRGRPRRRVRGRRGRRARAPRLTPLKLRRAKSPDDTAAATGGKTTIRLRLRELLDFSRQIKVMLASGVTILSTLALLRQRAKGGYQRLLDRIAGDIQRGATLSEALAAHPRTFDPFYVGTIRAGEAAGVHTEALAELIAYYELRLRYAANVIGALTYPAIVIVVLIGACILMLTCVIPQFEKVFASTKTALPLPTRALLGLSAFVTGHWQVLLVGVAVLAIIVWLSSRARGCATRAGTSPPACRSSARSSTSPASCNSRA